MKLRRWIKDWWRAKHTGYKRQFFDYRDWRYTPTGDFLKLTVDLRKYFLPVRDQSWSQACTGFAVASLLEYRMRRLRNIEEGMYYLSPLYNWWYAREREGTENYNTGVWLRDNLNALYEDGMCPEDQMPFNAPYYKASPQTDSEAHGELFKKYLIRTGYFLLRSSDVKEMLNKGNPVVFGIKLNNSFYGNTNGVIKNISSNNSSHAMLLVGYNDNSECYIARNSWGTNWGACFTDDTLIPLLDGSIKSIKDICEEYKDKDFWVHSYDVKKDKIVPGRAHTPRLTKKNAKIVKITLDNDREIKCTEDHLFLLKNNEYKKAIDLSTDDSIMPFNTQIDKDGYLAFYSPKTYNKIRVHWNTARQQRMFEGKEGKLIVHHKDFNKLNNTPENLEVMTVEEHQKLHKEFGRINGKKVMTKLWKEKRELMLENSRNNIKEYNACVKEGTIKKTKKQTDASRNNMRKAAAIQNERLKNGEVELTEKQINARRENARAMGLYNHKIKKIEDCGFADVYDFTVDKYHNFALDAGVFVHNSGYCYIPYDYFNAHSHDRWTIDEIEE